MITVELSHTHTTYSEWKQVAAAFVHKAVVPSG